jgi:hypothetical protein
MPYAYAVIEKGTREIKLLTLDEQLAVDTAQMLADGNEQSGYIVAGKHYDTDAEYEKVKDTVEKKIATMGRVKGEDN